MEIFDAKILILIVQKIIIYYIKSSFFPQILDF